MAVFPEPARLGMASGPSPTGACIMGPTRYELGTYTLASRSRRLEPGYVLNLLIWFTLVVFVQHWIHAFCPHLCYVYRNENHGGMMIDVFVSYAAEDRRKVAVITDLLVDAGWSV